MLVVGIVKLEIVGTLPELVIRPYSSGGFDVWYKVDSRSNFLSGHNDSTPCLSPLLSRYSIKSWAYQTWVLLCTDDFCVPMCQSKFDTKLQLVFFHTLYNGKRFHHLWTNGHFLFGYITWQIDRIITYESNFDNTFGFRKFRYTRFKPCGALFVFACSNLQ